MENSVVKKSDWRIQEMPSRKAKIRFKRSFTDEEIKNLRQGHIPMEQEDKWFWYCEDDVLYAHRSWTGICIFKVYFDFETGNHRVEVNRNRHQYKGNGRKKDLEMLNSLLDWFVQPQYDYYRQWIGETVDALQNNK